MKRTSQKFFLHKRDGTLIRSFEQAGDVIDYITQTELNGSAIEITDNYGVSASPKAVAIATMTSSLNPYFTYNPDGTVYAFATLFGTETKYHYKGQAHPKEPA